MASDYDLADQDSVADLHHTLDEIKRSAIDQQDEVFDPTGTANLYVDGVGLDANTSELGTSRGLGTWYSQTEATSTTSYVRSSDGEEMSDRTSRIAYTVAADGSLELVGATDGKKIDLLHTMFSTMSRLNIEQTLKKSDGDLDKAMDVLLNLAFFDETQAVQDEDQILIPKGVDGFGAEVEDIGRQKGRKKKQNKKMRSALPLESSFDSSPVPNKWEAGATDIEFISSRTPDIAESKIKSMYHANGMSLPATIRAIALENVPQESTEVEEDAVLATQVSELTQQFKTIPKATLAGLLKITRNIFSAASELAEALSMSPHPILAEMIKITADPLNLDEENDENVPLSGGRVDENPGPSQSYEQARSTADAHFAAGQTARQQAAQAARRARSNPLYGGASAYYREIIQEQRGLAMQHQSVASDRLVDRQSSNCDLDLHHVTVPHAIRITRERVERWWDALGDTKYVRGGGKSVHGGFKIVTGVGLHSQDGTSRLGPAVSKMLMSEGWRFEVDRGCLLVTGKARK